MYSATSILIAAIILINAVGFKNTSIVIATIILIKGIIFIDHFKDNASKTETLDNDVFPKPLTKAQRLKRAAVFWLRAAVIGKDYGVHLAMLKHNEVRGMKMSEQESEELWNKTHKKGAKKLADIITDMQGFYVKAAQIVATRGDLFPEQYIDELNQFADSLDPMPTEMVKAVITQELLKDGEKFDDVFATFDEKPLGAASIAQVHRAVLSKKYGSKEVAIKIQRPSIESKLIGDIINLKMIAKLFRGFTPVDYYTIFSEMEVQMKDEFDFHKEADAIDQIYKSLASRGGEMPVIIPRPITGLVTSRVLVMDYIRGVSLSKMQNKMQTNNMGSSKLKYLGSKFVKSLTEVFGRNVLESGLFHADLHPGNIMITDSGDIALIDFGQVKQLTPFYRETVAKIMVALDERRKGGGEEDSENDKVLASLIFDLGVELKSDAKTEAGAAIAMWLFDGSVSKLPGGYDMGETSPNSPVNEISVFPQDLVLLARSALLVKSFANRFGIPWSLAKETAPLAREVLLHGRIPPSSNRKKRKGLGKRMIRKVQKSRFLNQQRKACFVVCSQSTQSTARG